MGVVCVLVAWGFDWGSASRVMAFFRLADGFGCCFYGFGLSLHSYWFISVAPVRGGTYCSLSPRGLHSGRRDKEKSRVLKSEVGRTIFGLVHGRARNCTVGSVWAVAHDNVPGACQISCVLRL